MDTDLQDRGDDAVPALPRTALARSAERSRVLTTTSTVSGRAPVSERRGRFDAVVGLLSILVAAAPALAATVSLLGAGWFLNGDQAIEMLRTSDVGGPHTPLVGAWSRWGWAHPGPAIFWLMAPLHRLMGDDGALVTVGLLAAVCAGGVVVVAIRRGGTALGAITALGVVTFVSAFGLDRTLDPWNPFVALMPFLLFAFLVWSIASDDLILAPLAVLVGSLCIQSHVGYLPLVAGLAGAATLTVAVRHVVRRGRSDRAGRVASAGSGVEPAPEEATGLRAWWTRHPVGGPLVAAALVMVLVWLPTIVDELWGSRNLSALWHYMRSPGEPTAGWPFAFGVMNAQLRIPTQWMGAPEVDRSTSTITAGWMWSAGMVSLLLVALAAALRRHRRDLVLLNAGSIVGIGIALVATTRVAGLLAPYLTQWWWVISFMAVLGIVWTAACLTGIDGLRAVPVVALALAAGVGGFTTVRDIPVEPPMATVSVALSHLVDPTAAGLDRDARYTVHSVDRLLGASGPGLILALESRGYHVYAEPTDVAAIQYGSRRVLPPAQADGMIVIMGLDIKDLGWTPPEGSRELARYDPLSPAQRRELAALQRSVKARVGAPSDAVLTLDTPRSVTNARKHGVSEADILRMKELQSLGSGYVVYLTPPPPP